MKKIIIQTMKQKGFTLLELLVVIGIIGIMMALATVAYSTIQVSSRDSRKKQDLVAIQNALEQYYSETNYVYPTGDCTEAGSFLKSNWPVNPKDDSAYLGVDACTSDSYCICAEMEAASGKAGNTGTNDCVSWEAVDGDFGYYCVANLQ